MLPTHHIYIGWMLVHLYLLTSGSEVNSCPKKKLNISIIKVFSDHRLHGTWFVQIYGRCLGSWNDLMCRTILSGHAVFTDFMFAESAMRMPFMKENKNKLLNSAKVFFSD